MMSAAIPGLTISGRAATFGLPLEAPANEDEDVGQSYA